MKVIVITNDCNEFVGIAKNTEAIKEVISKLWDGLPVEVHLSDGTLTAEIFHGEGTNIAEGNSSVWDYRFWEEDVIGV